MLRAEYTLADLESAYKKLKSLIYYDKSDLAIRMRLAKFEVSNLDGAFVEILDVVNSPKPSIHESFELWLAGIHARVVPKSVHKDSPGKHVEDIDGIFISNFSSHKKLSVGKVNYFFDGPIELQIISTLWIIHEGKYLDGALTRDCYGSRLEQDSVLKDGATHRLFLRYHDLYKQWRDRGIKKARQMLVDEKVSVCILGLDIQEYYYHIDFDYQDAADFILEKARSGGGKVKKSLLRCLLEISKTYRGEIDSKLSVSHHISTGELPMGLPIGLISSPLLANWHLRKFDSAVIENIRPSYYGRYIDDIFIVVPAPHGFAHKTKPIENLIETILVKNGILNPLDNGRYEIESSPGLYLQQKKCILQHFDVNHSIAGLEKFKKDLEANSSDFLLLPVDDDGSSLEDVAYDLLYDGSVNKFRSVKGIAENRYELAKHLARQSMLHLLTTDKVNIGTRDGLLNFFKGTNAIDFYDLWERVLAFFVVSKDDLGFGIFCRNMVLEIDRIEYEECPEIAVLLKENLIMHLKLSKAISTALVLAQESLGGKEHLASRQFRQSNLIRHHFVKIPLINYTNFKGALISVECDSEVSLLNSKLKNSPRFVNFDECMLLVSTGILKGHVSNRNIHYIVERASVVFLQINGRPQSGVEVVREDEGKDEV